MQWKVFLPYLSWPLCSISNRRHFCGPTAFEFSSISSVCPFCLLSDIPNLFHLLMLVFPGTLGWVLFSSNTWGWSDTFLWLQQSPASCPLFRNTPSLAWCSLFCLRPAAATTHSTSMGPGCPAGTSNWVHPKGHLWHSNPKGQSGLISSLWTPGPGSLSSSTQLWVGQSLLANPLYLCLEPPGETSTLNGPFTSFLVPIADFPPRTWLPQKPSQVEAVFSLSEPKFNLAVLLAPDWGILMILSSFFRFALPIIWFVAITSCPFTLLQMWVIHLAHNIYLLHLPSFLVTLTFVQWDIQFRELSVAYLPHLHWDCPPLHLVIHSHVHTEPSCE